MPTIFSVRPGLAVAIRDRALAGAPMRLDLDDWGGYPQRTAIITGISVAKAGNYQFLHTLRGFIYVYVFGERIGDLILQGITFTGQCPGGGENGFDGVVDYYEQNAIAFRDDPVGVEIASSGFLAFLTAAKVDIVNPKAGLGQFTLKMNAVPRE